MSAKYANLPDIVRMSSGIYDTIHAYQLSGYGPRCVRNSGHYRSCRPSSQSPLTSIYPILGANRAVYLLQEESSEDEAAQAAQKRSIEPAPVEELDPTSLMSTQEASKQFRRAEKRKGR